MASDKKISQLPIATSINPSDISVLVDNGTDYQYTFTLLLSFLSANLSGGVSITHGTGSIPSSGGNNGDVYIKTDTGQFAQNNSGTWSVFYTVPTGGVSGSVIYYGSSVPTTIGNNGDTYILTSNGGFYNKISGTWILKYTMASGPAGPRGNSILNGAGAPSSGTGVNGDFYIDTVASVLYGPKASGVWPGSGLTLPGSAGNTILNGTVNPSNGIGNNGDFYLNTNTYNLFGPKASGVWPSGVNIGGSNAPSPLRLDYAKGIANPITVTWTTSFNNEFNNDPTIIIQTVIIDAILSLNTLVPGSGYVDGTYNNVPLTGGAGQNALATITISGGLIASVVIVPGFAGLGYALSDTLSASNTNLGGTGTGFSIKVATLGTQYNDTNWTAIRMFDATGTLLQSFSVSDPDPANAMITADAIRIIIKL